MADDEPVDEAQGMQDSVGLLLLSRREQGRTLTDPQDLPPLLTLAEVYGVHRALSATASVSQRHLARCFSAVLRPFCAVFSAVLCAVRLPGAETERMGENWRKMGEIWGRKGRETAVT